MNLSTSFFKKINVLLIFFCLIITSAIAQDNSQEHNSEFWKNVRFGGAVGLSFGDGFFSGTLAPSAIYQFNDKFSAGVGLNATYNKRKNFYKSTILGGSILSYFNPLREIQLSAEFEELNVSRKYEGNFANTPNDNYWYPALFVGAGYRTRNVTIGIRYDVLYDEEKSVYANAWAPFFRVFF